MFEGQRQIQAVTLTAGEHTRFLLLIRSLEPERRNIGARRHLNIANLNIVQTVRDNLPQALFGVNIGAVLIDIGNLHGFADLERAAVEFFQTDDGLEQGRFTHTVRTNHTHNAVPRQRERQTVNERAPVKTLLQVLGLNHQVAQARSRRNLNLFKVEFAGLFSFGRHLFVTCQTCFRLRLTTLRV